jgi:uncharacterized membrane protein YidH (DUF202 family)
MENPNKKPQKRTNLSQKLKNRRISVRNNGKDFALAFKIVETCRDRRLLNCPPELGCMKISKDVEFWSASVIVLLTVFLSVATYLRWFRVNFYVGPFFLGHWLGWIGTIFIAFLTPSYYVLKRRYPKRLKSLLRIHMFGNLFSFMLISIHFAQQIGRPSQFYPDLGTGLILYVVVLILVSTGFFHRFRILESRKVYPPHRNRFLHISITLSFYLVIIVHVLRNLRIL